MPRYTKQTKRMRKGDILLSTYTDRTLVKHLQWQPLLKSPSVYMSHLTLQQPSRIIRLSAALQRETTTRPSWLVSRACLHFPQTASNKHSVRRGTSVCSSSCSCSGGFELTFVCQCVSGMFDAALLLWWLTAVLFKPREWGPGLFPVGIHMWGGGYGCVWVILLCRDVRIGNWTPRYLAMPPLQLHAHGFTAASDKDKTTSALQADGGRETKEAQILIRSMRPEPVCATVFSLQMFVLHRGDIFAQTTQRKQFSSSCNNNRQPDFIYEILSKDVGEETSWQVSETTSVSSLTMGDIPHDELNLVSETFNPFWKPGFSFLNSLKPVLTSC